MRREKRRAPRAERFHLLQRQRWDGSQNEQRYKGLNESGGFFLQRKEEARMVTKVSSANAERAVSGKAVVNGIDARFQAHASAMAMLADRLEFAASDWAMKEWPDGYKGEEHDEDKNALRDDLLLNRCWCLGLASFGKKAH